MRITNFNSNINRNNKGFTLTELIIVIVLIGIISAAIGPLIGNKFAAVAQSTDRARWVQQAEFTLFHIRQDLANSVPNSVFTSEPLAGADQAFEMLTAPANNSVYAARYRNKPLNPYNQLKPNAALTFDLFGTFNNIPRYVSIGTAESTAAVDMRTDWQNKAAADGTIAEVLSSSTFAAENGSPITNIILTASHKFGGGSPYFRAYFTNGPVAYYCNGGTLSRISGYSSLATGTILGVRVLTGTPETHRVTSEVVNCEFILVGGSVYQPPVLEVTLSIGNGTESIQLIDTITLGNGS